MKKLDKVGRRILINKRMSILLLLLALTGPFAFSQSLNRLLHNASNPPVTIAHNDSVKVVNLLPNGVKVKPDIRRLYFWYSGNKLQSTQGDYAGKLLNGDYKVFNSEKDLLVKGTFKKGLKSERWIHWYKNGSIRQIENWRKGVKNGAFEVYEPNGNIKSKGTYKNGLLHGRIYNYTKGEEQITGYENGTVIDEESKKQRNKFKWWKPGKDNKKSSDKRTRNSSTESSEKGKGLFEKLKKKPSDKKETKTGPVQDKGKK